MVAARGGHIGLVRRFRLADEGVARSPGGLPNRLCDPGLTAARADAGRRAARPARHGAEPACTAHREGWPFRPDRRLPVVPARRPRFRCAPPFPRAAPALSLRTAVSPRSVR